MSAVLQRPPVPAGPRRVLGMVVAFLALLSGLAIGAPLAVPSVSAAVWPPDPNVQAFTCPPEGFLLQRPQGQDDGGSAYEIDLVNPGTITPTAVGMSMNGIGYNLADNYIYGNSIDVNAPAPRDRGGAIRLGQNGAQEYLGFPADWPTTGGGLPIVQKFLAGDISADGLWVTGSGDPDQSGPDQGKSVMYLIDMAPGANYFTYVREIKPDAPVGYNGMPDFVFLGNQMYQLWFDETNNNEVHLFRINPLAPNPTFVDPLAAPLMYNGAPWVMTGIGAVYADRTSGLIYASSNGNGDIYVINRNTGQVALFSTSGEQTSQNDGARCQSARVVIDYGDAPDSYGTSVVNNGARASIQSGISLGARIDIDSDGQPTPDASGDDFPDPTDVTVIDDEDAFQPGPLVIDSNAPALTIPITNTSGGPVTVAGWMDLNGNDVFDAGERQIANNVTTGPVTLTWPAANGTGANTFARLRIAEGGNVDLQPTGAASHGEVEDYPVTLGGSYHVEKSASVPSGSVQSSGTPITYTITVMNDSSIDLPASLTDPLGDVLDDASLVSGPTVSDGSSASIDGSNVLNWSGTVPRGIGSTVTVTYSVVINPTLGNARLFNAVQGDGCPPGSTAPPCGHEVFPGTYSVSKSANIAEGTSVAVGTPITYTITVTPSGASVPASFTDNLTAVLDDASGPTGLTASSGTPSYDPTTRVLTWTGATTPGVPITVSYTVVVNNVVGDGRLENAVVGLGCPQGATAPPCSTEVLAGSYTVSKQASPASGTVLVPGQPITYTITVNKTGAGAVTGATFTDDLTGVLDDATGPTNITGGATMNGNTLQWTGDFGGGSATATITYTMTVKPAAQLQQSDGVLTNGVSGPNCAPTTPGCFTTNPVRAWTVVKSATPAPAPNLEVSPSSQVVYHLRVENTGGIAIPDAALTDNLGGVLDDATVTSGPTSGASITNGVLSWSGALPVGQVVFIDYTVTLDAYADLGDGTLFNAVAAPEAGCPASVVTDPAAPGYNPNCSTYHYTPRLNYNKTSNAANPVRPGDLVTYTITVTNPGTAAVPSVPVTDDLTAVLDDATLVGSPTGPGTAPAINGNILSWTGPVNPGTPVVITYTVRVKTAVELGADSGDGVLRNSALIPRTPCVDGQPACAPNINAIDAWTYTKTSDPAPGAVVSPGDQITYTIAIANTGGLALTNRSVSDDMSDVLDDATLTSGPTIRTGGNGSVTPPDTNDVITWTGNLAIGEVVYVDYTVTVRPAYQIANGVVGNQVTTTSGGQCTGPAPCGTTEHEVRSWDVLKEADVTDVTPGATVDYTITVTNTGSVAITGASWTDDLSGITDDAVVTTEPATTSGTVDRDADEISWNGDLAVDQVVKITYSVRVNRPLTGDRSLTNAVFTPDVDGPCNTVNPIPERCQVILPGKELTIVKATEPADREFAEPNEKVFYTLTITNTGALPYAPAIVDDDMTAALDDAAGAPTDITVIGPGSATFDPATKVLHWTGPLAVDQQAVVRYAITVSPQVTGDAHLLNVVTSPTAGALCPTPAVTNPDAPGFDANCVTDTPIKAYAIHKSSDPADGSEVEPGDTITYTLTLTNTGDVDVTGETVTDDLSGVLDDATLDGDPAASDGDASITGTTLTWTGDLAVGAEVTVTYSVIVEPADEAGDAIIANVVSGTGPSNCYDPQITNPQDPRFDADCATESKVKEYTIVKTADPEAGSEVESGDEITYTVTLTNTGEVALTDLEVTDSLTDVLDDADVTTEPAADAGTVERVDDVITWTGDLAIDEVVVITYTVTVKPVLELGDGLVGNVVTGTGPNQCPNPPITDADDPAYDARCSVAELVKAYTIVKSSDPADDATVQPFDRITYTLTLSNVGTAPSDGVTVTDTLTDVLDDADLDGAPVASAGTASVTGDVLTWTGDLAVADVVTITYVAVVKAPTALGNSHLGNVVVGTGNSSCPDPADPVANPDCETHHGVAAYTTLKEVVSPVSPRPGESVTYRVTVTSVGSVPVVGETISDDLTGVLDDAVWDNTAAFTAGNPATTGALAFNAPTLSWTGDIAVDDVLVITYSLTLAPQITGDGWLRNLVVSNDCPFLASMGSPLAFANAAMPPNCQTDTAIPSVAFAKTVSPAGPFKPGDVVTYTITATNNGQLNLDGITWSDDMTRVLDDADMVGQPSSDRGAASYSTPMVSWTGSLAVGEVAHVTYQVTIRESRGDGSMPNGVVGVGPASNCPATGAAAECLTLALVLPSVVPNDPSDPGELPRTGGNTMGMVWIAFMLLAAGVGLVAVRRRRRSITS